MKFRSRKAALRAASILFQDLGLGMSRGAGGADLDAPANTARWIGTRALHLRSGPGRSGVAHFGEALT